MYTDQEPLPEPIHPEAAPPSAMPPKPAASDPGFAQEIPLKEKPAPVDKRKRNILIGAGLVALIMICCCGTLILGLAWDPFGWGLFDRLLGRHDAAAQAMPADTSVYIGINLLNLTPEKIERITAPFQDAIDEISGGEYDDTGDITREFEDMLAEELNMTFEDDILPWLGQYAGIGLSDLRVNLDYGELEDGSFVLAIEVRDRDAADAFLDKLIRELEYSMGYDFRSLEYEKAQIFEMDTDYDPERVAFARSGRLMLIGRNAADLRAAIDAQNGDALSDMNDFRDLTRQLPRERALTLYLSGGLFNDLYASGNPLDYYGLNIEIDDLYRSIKGMAAAVSITDEGLQFDGLASYDIKQLPQAQLDMLNNTTSDGKLAEMFPAETVFLLNGARLDLIWNFYKETLTEAFGGEDYDEMMAELTDEIGFNIDTELLPYLDGEYAFGVVQRSDGMLVEMGGVNLGLLALAEISDEKAVGQVVEQVIDLIQEQDATIRDLSTKGLTIYEAGDEYMEQPVMALAVGNDTLGIGTSGDLLHLALTGSDMLDKSDTYRLVWRAFPRGTAPVLYLDLQSLLDTLLNIEDEYTRSDIEDAAVVLEPIHQIAMGTSGLKDGIVQTTLIIFLAQP